MKALILLCFLSATAFADDTIILRVQPDYSFLANAGKRDFDRAAQAIGDAGAIVASKKTIIRSVMVVNCDKAIRITRIFADGHNEITDLGGVPVTSTDLAEAAAVYPSLQIIAGCQGN